MQNKPQLIIIPVIHTRADFGSLKDKVPLDLEYETLANSYWDRVQSYLRELSKSIGNFSHLKVYQDGLPHFSPDRVATIINETQTPNYEVLRWLKNQGACILGTENPPLLLEEYNSLKAIFGAADEESKNVARLEYQKKSKLLLEARDAFIAQRIKETLFEGEIGILFIGVAHNIDSILKEGVEISAPEALIGCSLPELRLKTAGKERER